MNENWVVFASIALGTLRMSTPLIFASMGGLLSERAGIINIALEGLMLMGAFFGAIGAAVFHSSWAGMFCAIVSGVIFGAFYGLLTVYGRANQIVAGTGINILALGLPPILLKTFFPEGGTGSSPALDIAERFQSAPILVAFAIVGGLHLFFRYTRGGLWLHMAGEHPGALESAGKSVRKLRLIAVTCAGVLAALGGLTLSTMLSSSFTRNMSAGRGFMALAALIFGKWMPIPAMWACLFFGFTETLQISLQGKAFFGDVAIPVELIQVLPYLVTIFVLASFVGKARAPRYLGEHFEPH